MKYISQTNIYIYIVAIVVSVWECSDLYHISGGVLLITCSNFIAVVLNYYRWKVSIFESDVIIPVFLSTLTVFAALLYVVMAYAFFSFLVVHVPCHVHMILGCGLSVAFHFTDMNSHSIVRHRLDSHEKKQMFANNYIAGAILLSNPNLNMTQKKAQDIANRIIAEISVGNFPKYDQVDKFGYWQTYIEELKDGDFLLSPFTSTGLSIRE